MNSSGMGTRPQVPRAAEGRPPGPDNVMIVRDALRTALVRGDYADRPLPGEHELQRVFGASRATVRRALDILRDEGMIKRLRGSGTLVGIEKIPHRDIGFKGLGGPGSSIVHIVAERRVIKVPDMVADLLGVGIDEPILYLRRKTITGTGQIVSMFTSYLTLPLAEPLADPAADLSGEYYGTLESLIGRRLRENTMVLEAVQADDITAHEMEIESGAPVFRYERVLLLDVDEPLEFGVGFQRGDRIRLLLDGTRP